MIKNSKQASITKEKLRALQDDFKTFEDSIASRSEAEIILARNSFESLIGDLEKDLNEYRALCDGNLHILQPVSFEEFYKLLIGSRIAQNISQRDLADRLGIHEQQIQRYEATDYESANYARLIEVAMALNLSCYLQSYGIFSSPNGFNYPSSTTADQVANAETLIKGRGSILSIQ